MEDHLGLLCEEGGDFLYREVADDASTFGRFERESAFDDEFVGILFEREINFGFRNDESFAFDDWIKCARLEAINWVLKTRGVFGFKFQTAYLSLTYFDRLLSIIPITNEKLWVIRALSIACLSLAAKMEEFEVPGLSQIQLQDYNFESKAIKRMEFLVLYTLEWKMSPITPFTFIHYFVSKLCQESTPRNLHSEAVRLIFAAIGEINSMNYRPSVLAVAATMVEMDQSLTREALELKINSILHCEFLDIASVFSAYKMIQKVKVERLEKDPGASSSPDLFSNHDRKFSLSLTTARCSKRKLEFTNIVRDHDHDHDNEDQQGHG